MYFKYDEKTKITFCHTEVDDKCCMCSNFEACPLMGAISRHIVYPACEALNVTACEMFEREEL